MALTADERKWSLGMIEEFAEGEECVDNFRMADKNDAKEMELFEEQSFNGCCGTMEKEVKHPETGKAILIGCNFGH